MRIFVLEDDLMRLRLLGERWQDGDTITHVDTCMDAHRFQPPYDLVLLDHDLGGRQMKLHEDCGLTFVRMVHDELMRADVRRIVIHSYNPDGAYRMAQELLDRDDVYIAPFGGPDFWRHLTAAREAGIISNPAEEGSQ